MKKLREIFGELVSEYGREFAVEAIQNLLYHEVKSRRMTVAESNRIFAEIRK